MERLPADLAAHLASYAGPAARALARTSRRWGALVRSQEENRPFFPRRLRFDDAPADTVYLTNVSLAQGAPVFRYLVVGKVGDGDIVYPEYRIEALQNGKRTIAKTVYMTDVEVIDSRLPLLACVPDGGGALAFNPQRGSALACEAFPYAPLFFQFHFGAGAALRSFEGGIVARLPAGGGARLAVLGDTCALYQERASDAVFRVGLGGAPLPLHPRAAGLLKAHFARRLSSPVEEGAKAASRFLILSREGAYTCCDMETGETAERQCPGFYLSAARGDVGALACSDYGRPGNVHRLVRLSDGAPLFTAAFATRCSVAYSPKPLLGPDHFVCGREAFVW